LTKEDVPPLPDRVPTKRQQVCQLLDVHIAMWLADENLSYPERKRLEAEKRRRKEVQHERSMGLLIGPEGMTPIQQEAVERLLQQSRVTVIHHPIVSPRLHYNCKLIASVRVWREGSISDRLKKVVLEADEMIAAPKELREPRQKVEGTVWWAIKYAKFRRKPVNIVMSTGRVLR
jgi:hypothetical protein